MSNYAVTLDQLLARFPDHKPLECWIAENGALAGTSEREHILFGAQHTRYFIVPGKAQKYIVFTNDNRITYAEALRFTIAVHFGAVKTLTINLKNL